MVVFLLYLVIQLVLIGQFVLIWMFSRFGNVCGVVMFFSNWVIGMGFGGDMVKVIWLGLLRKLEMVV